MLRVDDDKIIHVMTSQGFSEDAIRAEIAGLRANPYYQAGAETAQSLQKIESMLEIRCNLRALLPSAKQIERRRRVRREDFLAQYYAENSPVILLDIADTWPARSLWTLDYLEEQLRGESAEIMAGRDGDRDYERFNQAHRTRVKFEEYIKYLRQNAKSNDRYLVANNNILDLPKAKKLRDDFESPAEYLDQASTEGKNFLWLGPAGTVTPLHHDIMNVLIVQVIGSKRFTLIDPLRTGYVYNDYGVYSAVDVADPDYARFPLFKYANPVSIILEPGEALFIPVGWWHHVESLDLSASISFTNFVFPNEFHWQQPNPSCL